MIRRFSFTALFAVLPVVAAALPAAAAPPGLAATAAPTTAQAASIAPSRYIVTYRSGVDPSSEVARAIKTHGARALRVMRSVGPIAVLELSEVAARALRSDLRVARIEADGSVSASETQSNATWGLDRLDQRTLPLSGGYTYSAAGSNVDAYVIDTGVRASHQDFANRTKTGYTAVLDGYGTEDCNGHGTHVAGTVAGTQWGVAKATSVIPVRVLDCTGSGTWSQVIAGIDWVIQHHQSGVPAVANLSLGGGASASLDDAINRLVQDGVTVAVAAGNSNVDACTTSPARVPAALTVGAAQSNDARASFSNFGSCLDVFAPGVSITSAWYTGSAATNTISGTSMAAPHVAGAAAILLSQNPSFSPAQVAASLLANATPNVVTSAGSNSPNRLLHIPAATPTTTTTAPSTTTTTAPSTTTTTTPSTTTPSASAPGTATTLIAKPLRKAASLTWTAAPANGAPLTANYVAGYSGSRQIGYWKLAGSATGVTVTGLSTSSSYSFTVTACNSVGCGPVSARSNTVTPTR